MHSSLALKPTLSHFDYAQCDFVLRLTAATHSIPLRGNNMVIALCDLKNTGMNKTHTLARIILLRGLYETLGGLCVKILRDKISERGQALYAVSRLLPETFSYDEFSPSLPHSLSPSPSPSLPR